MKLDFDICNGGRINGQNIIGIRYNGIDIFSLIGYYNAYTVEILPDGNRTVEFIPLYDSDYYKKKEYYDMGDGSIFYEDITDCTYTYKEPGTYLIITSGEIFGGSNLGLNYNVVAINGIRRDIKKLYTFCSYSTLREFNPVNIKTSNVTDMSWMFSNCKSLISLDISNLDTSNVTKMNRMFANCNSLEVLNLSNFDASSVTDASYMFYKCTALTDFIAPRNISVSIDFSYCTKLTHDSLMSIINNLATVTDKTLTLGATNLAKLSEEEKAIATNKGWIFK
jgi:surface protein